MIPPLPSPRFKNIPYYYPEIQIFSEHDLSLLFVYKGIVTANPPSNSNSTMRYIKLDGELVHILDRVSGRVLLNQSVQMVKVRAILETFESMV